MIGMPDRSGTPGLPRGPGRARRTRRSGSASASAIGRPPGRASGPARASSPAPSSAGRSARTSRAAPGGRSSGVPSTKPAFDWKKLKAWVESASSVASPARAPPPTNCTMRPADALVLVGGPHAQAGQLALALLRVDVEGHAGDRVPVHLEDVVVVELASRSRRACAAASSSLSTEALDQLLDAAHVALARAADLPVLVGVDERADALVREDLGQQALVDAGR